MPSFMRGFVTGGASTNSAYVDFRTNSTVPAQILEIGITLATGSNTELGLLRTATVGTTSTTQTPEKMDPASAAATLVIGTAWSSAPTIAGTPLDLIRQYIGGTVGNGAIWTFHSDDDRLLIAVSSSIVLWNRGAAQGATLHGWVKWRE